MIPFFIYEFQSFPTDLSFWLTMMDDFSDSEDESSVSTSPSTPFIFLISLLTPDLLK
jgi:hypothetical protein